MNRRIKFIQAEKSKKMSRRSCNNSRGRHPHHHHQLYNPRPRPSPRQLNWNNDTSRGRHHQYINYHLHRRPPPSPPPSPPPPPPPQPAAPEMIHELGIYVNISRSTNRMWLLCLHCYFSRLSSHDTTGLLDFSTGIEPRWRCCNCHSYDSRWGFLIIFYDSDRRVFRWGFCENGYLPDNQNSMEDVDDNNDDSDDDYDSYHYYVTKNTIWKYLITRDSGMCRDEGDVEICVVCQSQFQTSEIFKRLDCGHNYHDECISQWLLYKNSCPLCIKTIIPPDFEDKFDNFSLLR